MGRLSLVIGIVAQHQGKQRTVLQLVDALDGFPDVGIVDTHPGGGTAVFGVVGVAALGVGHNGEGVAIGIFGVFPKETSYFDVPQFVVAE